MTNWTSHIKEFAKKQGITYKEAMKDPKCKESYVKPAKGEGVNLVVKEIKKKGKQVKGMLGLGVDEINDVVKGVKKGKKQIKKILGLGVDDKTDSESNSDEGKEKEEKPKAKRRGRPPKVKGEGLIVKYKTENDNGLAHIYPLSHQQILDMVSRG